MCVCNSVSGFFLNSNWGWMWHKSCKLACTVTMEHMEGPRLLAGGGDLLISALPSPAMLDSPTIAKLDQTRPDQLALWVWCIFRAMTFRAASTWAVWAALCQPALQGDEPMLRDMVMDTRRERDKLAPVSLSISVSDATQAGTHSHTHMHSHKPESHASFFAYSPFLATLSGLKIKNKKTHADTDWMDWDEMQINQTYFCKTLFLRDAIFVLSVWFDMSVHLNYWITDHLLAFVCGKTHPECIQKFIIVHELLWCLSHKKIN